MRQDAARHVGRAAGAAARVRTARGEDAVRDDAAFQKQVAALGVVRPAAHERDVRDKRVRVVHLHVSHAGVEVRVAVVEDDVSRRGALAHDRDRVRHEQLPAARLVGARRHVDGQAVGQVLPDGVQRVRGGFLRRIRERRRAAGRLDVEVGKEDGKVGREREGFHPGRAAVRRDGHLVAPGGGVGVDDFGLVGFHRGAVAEMPRVGDGNGGFHDCGERHVARREDDLGRPDEVDRKREDQDRVEERERGRARLAGGGDADGIGARRHVLVGDGRFVRRQRRAVAEVPDIGDRADGVARNGREMRDVVRADDELRRVHRSGDVERGLQLVASDVHARTGHAHRAGEIRRRNAAVRRVVGAGVARDGVLFRRPVPVRRVGEVHGADREAGRVQLRVEGGVEIRSAVDVAAEIAVVLAHAVRPAVVRVAARVGFPADRVAVDDAVDGPGVGGEDVDAGEAVRRVVDDRAVDELGAVLEGDGALVLGGLVRRPAGAFRDQAVLDDGIARRHDVHADGAVVPDLAARDDAARAPAVHQRDVSAAEVRVVRVGGASVLDDAVLDRAAVVADQDVAAVAGGGIIEQSVLDGHEPELRVGVVDQEDAGVSRGGVALEDDVRGVAGRADDFDGRRDDDARGAGGVIVGRVLGGSLRRRERIRAGGDAHGAAGGAELGDGRADGDERRFGGETVVRGAAVRRDIDRRGTGGERGAEQKEGGEAQDRFHGLVVSGSGWSGGRVIRMVE